MRYGHQVRTGRLPAYYVIIGSRADDQEGLTSTRVPICRTNVRVAVAGCSSTSYARWATRVQPVVLVKATQIFGRLLNLVRLMLLR